MIIFPYRCKNPPESFPIGTIALIAINILVFLLTSNLIFIRENVVENWALYPAHFHPLRIFTAMFLHKDILHLLGNMWFLYLLGFAVEGRLRTPKFIALYVVSGCAGDLLQQMVFGIGDNIPSLGASGAIMGVMGAALYMFPFSLVEVYWRIGLFWADSFLTPMWVMGLWYLGQDFLLHLLMRGGDGVGHLAHLGGAIGGAAMAFAFRALRDNVATSNVKATLDENKELHRLSPHELQTLVRNDPKNTHLIVHWMHRCLQEPEIPQQALSAVHANLPRILEEEDLLTVAYCVSPLLKTQYAPTGDLLRQLAQKLEDAKQYEQAIFYYEELIKSSRTRPNDRHLALFRAAQLYERVLRQPPQAIRHYRTLVAQDPMGSFSDIARSRLAALELHSI